MFLHGEYGKVADDAVECRHVSDNADVLVYVVCFDLYVWRERNPEFLDHVVDNHVGGEFGSRFVLGCLSADGIQKFFERFLAALSGLAGFLDEHVCLAILVEHFEGQIAESNL